ncbi:ABC transporter permease [Kutzneria sp. CA-103260]|uniref:ABC transporter permease n=1 Tax=Kutzneria sp. CA-103260 TaxID=2802641 RepID=UPI001BA85F9D|nr:ABC transporter permease [Kutzneria sp. CA-103260]QUQ68052.1 spermidine/putrescine ABC transporter permease [Kutzneria sp. CA-103260]
MTFSRTTRRVLLAALVLGLAVIYFPLLVVFLNSFNDDPTFGWPPAGFTLEWWSRAAANEGALAALRTSVVAGLSATAIALVLGTMAAFALQRYRFIGRNPVSLLVVLPIALPGIVTGIALNNAFRTILGVNLGLFTAIVAHATFCIVVVFNNVVARLRRMGNNLEEASMDLGADGITTFRLVTFPMLRSALLAGGLLAFALSFDEIIVTTFTLGAGMETVPIWIYDNLFRPNQAPIVNVVAAVLILASTVPVYLAQRLSGDSASGGRL